MDEKNVSVVKIREGVTKMQDDFMAPIEKVALEVIAQYEELNQSLHSEVIDTLIAEQKNKLDSLKSDLKEICDRTEAKMEDSSSVVAANNANIDESMTIRE